MVPNRGFEMLVHQHQEELIGQAGSRRARRSSASTTEDSPTQCSAAGHPVTGGRAVRRAVAPRLGGWFIELGTRLGGARVQASS